jgi:XTP/dITP diphosphohydrolase
VTRAGAREAPPEVVVATGNAGKLREFRELLADAPVRLRGLEGLAVDFPEEGVDYAANAAAKARAAAEATGVPALADDSGLEVVGLGGGPGPRSARFGGPGLDDRERTAALLSALASRPGASRAARFVCVAALAVPGGGVVTARGECAGRILAAPRGGRGFGYDPIFEVRPGRSMAELPPAEKNRISHRARALAALGSRLAALAGPRAGG